MALVSAVAAQDAAAYATGLLAALNSFKCVRSDPNDETTLTLTSYSLTTLAAVATANADALLPLLMEGNHTVFAPTDAVRFLLLAALSSSN